MSEPGPGDSIAGRYRLLDELGGGGMGVVFRARDEALGRDVAIKLLRFGSPEATRRLQREARATERLDPARVAQVYDAGETAAGLPFLVMEYVEGRTLRALLREGGIERAEALRVLREIATTLAAAHESGLVHRDVKPDNVIVRSDGRVVLLDFGIVKQLDPSEDAAHITTQLTSEGTMIGTPAYLAPEQALGRDVDPAADQFALAVTAFELLTGRIPWTGSDVTRVLAQLLAGSPPPASQVNPSVPPAFDGVFSRALAKSPDARFTSVTAFADALEAAERGLAMPSPASHTLDGPEPLRAALPPIEPPPAPSAEASVLPTPDVPASTSVAPSPPPRRRAPRVSALLTLVSAALGVVFLARARSHGAAALALDAAAPPTLTVSARAPLACPIFAVEGVPDVTARLGAAASSLACARARWYLGGGSDRILVAAALSDAPVQPREDLRSFYDAPDIRGRSLAAAKARGLPSLEGSVARGRDTWRIELVVRDPEGREVARAGGVEGRYLDAAIKDAVARLWQTAPLAAAVIDPDVARWTAYPDVDAGLLELDVIGESSRLEGCAGLRRRGAELGRSYPYLAALCGDAAPAVDGGALPLDESSPSALVTSLNAILETTTAPFSEAETRRLALELESLRGRESSPLGRASLGRLAGMLWADVHEPARADAALRPAVADDPLLLPRASRGTGLADAVTALASVWQPEEPRFLRYAAASTSDALPDRLRDAQLAYLLAPTVERTRLLGRAFAEAGRAEEVRALTVTTPAGMSAPDPSTATFLLACIDLHDGMFARALKRFEAASPAGIETIPVLAEVLGTSHATALTWAQSFVAAPDPEARVLARSAGAIALCMNAGSGLADRCLSRLRELGGEGKPGALDGEPFFLGAKRLAAGDARGAIRVWRPLVAGPDDELARLLPTAVFERAGELDLAARIDARKMAYRLFAGISDAAPREARRALEHGDKLRARELARSVVQAWEVADGIIPAVEEMRSLLAKNGE